jgi:hypothetical protein
MELAKYKACICEGSAENAIIDILLDNDLLIFTREEMLEEEVIRCRDGKRFEEKYLRKGFLEKISEGSTFETDKGYQQQTPWVGIANTNQKLMMQAASEFGLTPSARSRIMAASGVGKDEEDEMEALLGGEA